MEAAAKQEGVGCWGVPQTEKFTRWSFNNSRRRLFLTF